MCAALPLVEAWPDWVVLCAPSQVIITAALNPDKLVAKAGEERLKERVRKVLSGVIAKLESDPRMKSSIG
jgi:hypothetical protein